MTDEILGKFEIIITTIFVIAMIVGGIIVSINCLQIIVHNEDMYQQFCIDNGYNKSTDRYYSYDQKSDFLECDNNIQFEVDFFKRCVEYNKWNNCIKKEQYIIAK